MPRSPTQRRSPLAEKPRAEPPRSEHKAARESAAGFTTRQVAEASGLPASKILAWTRAGLLTPQRLPGGAYVFSFQDVVLLRATRDLLDLDVSTRRVRTAVEALRLQLPSDRPLSAVQIGAVGDKILVRDEDSVWEPNSGQMQMDFDAPASSVGLEQVNAAPLPDPTTPEDAENVDDEDRRTADDWYDAALDLEATDVDKAADAYRQALVLEPAHADAHLNLGRLLHEAGELDVAEAHYRAASDADPGSARARFNLGVVLEDRRRPDDAIAAYREALRLDDRLAPAHYNLSRLYEARGDGASAIAHLMAYKKLLTSRPPSAS